MVFFRCLSSELQFGSLREVVARERQGGALSRKAWQGEVARAIGRVSTRFGEGGGKLDRRRARGVLYPCARGSEARTGRFLRKKLSLATVYFRPTRANKEPRTGKICVFFCRNAQGFGRLDVGSRAGFTSSRPPSPWTSVFHFPIFLHDVWS